MARKKHSPEQIVAILRQIEVAIAHNKPTPQACREAGINEQSYYRWRKEYGGLNGTPISSRSRCRSATRWMNCLHRWTRTTVSLPITPRQKSVGL